MNWQIDGRMIGVVVFGLVMFGIAYNFLMHHLGQHKQGYLSLFVAGGVLVTLAGLALIDARAAVLALVCFAASGAPMIAGEIVRSMIQHERVLKALRAQQDGRDE